MTPGWPRGGGGCFEEDLVVKEDASKMAEMEET